MPCPTLRPGVRPAPPLARLCLITRRPVRPGLT